MDASMRNRLVRTHIPNIVERGGQIQHSLLNSFNIESTSIQHVSTRLKGGRGADCFNIAVQSTKLNGY